MIDLNTVLPEFGDDVGFLKEMVDEFLSYVPEQIHEIRKAVDVDDAQTVERQAHSIKGAARTLGIHTIPDLAFKIESMGRETDLTHISEYLDDLETESGKLRQYTDTVLAKKIG